MRKARRYWLPGGERLRSIYLRQRTCNLIGTTAHGYLVFVVITALLITGYLLLRSGWGEEFPFPLPVAHEALLLAGTGVQFVLVLAAFLDVPLPGLGWDIGAYLAVAAAALAAVPAALPALRSRHSRR